MMLFFFFFFFFFALLLYFDTTDRQSKAKRVLREAKTEEKKKFEKEFPSKKNECGLILFWKVRLSLAIHSTYTPPNLTLLCVCDLQCYFCFSASCFVVFFCCFRSNLDVDDCYIGYVSAFDWGTDAGKSFSATIPSGNDGTAGWALSLSVFYFWVVLDLRPSFYLPLRSLAGHQLCPVVCALVMSLFYFIFDCSAYYIPRLVLFLISQEILNEIVCSLSYS